MDKKGTYKLYRMWCRKVLAFPSRGIDTRYLADDFTPSRVTFKGRNFEEALRKAKKFWIEGKLGMGSFILKEIT